MPENAPAHTPGPWEWHDARTMRHLVAPNSERRALGVSMPLPAANKAYRCVTGEDAANARLIAAAPDLLAALRQLRRQFNPYYPTDKQAAAAAAADAAIAKATGNSQNARHAAEAVHHVANAADAVRLAASYAARSAADATANAPATGNSQDAPAPAPGTDATTADGRFVSGPGYGGERM